MQGRGGFGRGQQAQAPSFKVVKGRTYNIELQYTKGESGSAYLTFELSQRKLAEFESVAKKVKDADVIIMVSGISARLEGEEMRVNYEGFTFSGQRVQLRPSV